MVKSKLRKGDIVNACRDRLISGLRDSLEKSLTDKQLEEEENEKSKIRVLAKSNLFYLGKNILGYRELNNTHKRWNDWTNKHIDLTGGTPSKNLILQPREVYKTTFFTITLSIAILLNNPELSILIVNDTHEIAKNMLKEIKSHFEKNEKLRDLFGNYVSTDDWSKESITINRKTKNMKEKSISVAGIGTALTSIHPDIIIADDIAGKKDKESQAGRDQTLSFFQDVWDLLKKDNGIYIMPGTRKHVYDIYNHIKEVINPHLLKEKLQGFNIMETSAHKDGDPDNDALNFPDILPEKKLKELRIVKEGQDGTDFATYMAEYELRPLDPKTQIFKEFTFEDHQHLTYDKIVQWTDPALKETKTSDYSAIVVIGRIKDGEFKGKFMCLYASIDKRPPTKLIQDHNRIYRDISEVNDGVIYHVYMEDNGFQALMKDGAIRKSLNDGKAPVPTKGKANMHDKDSRIQWQEPFITTGVYMFRKDWKSAPENYRLLVEQFQNYPQAKKDGPDASQGALKRITKRGPGVW